jgi:hypothetical protein
MSLLTPAAATSLGGLFRPAPKERSEPAAAKKNDVPMNLDTLIKPTLVLAMAGALSTPSHLPAQDAPSDEGRTPVRTWKDLGLDDLPAGYSSHQVPLFEGLNQSRGRWVFKGSLSTSDATTPLEGRLDVSGSFKDGMFPMWNLALGWPAEAPGQHVRYTIIATPEEKGFKLILARIGPGKMEAEAKPNRAMFQGEWKPETRKIIWTPMAMAPSRPNPPAGSEPGGDASGSFEMILGASGTITIKHAEPADSRQPIMGKTMARIGQPFVEETASGRTRFDTVAEVSDPRVKRCLPPDAADIVLHRERAGHFARYRVSEAGFHRFLDRLWEVRKDDSAHQRDQMYGEGKPANREDMAKRFEPLGWEPLKNVVIHYSPSKANGAMTTYYYDREAGIAYHDTGYW